MKRLPDLAPITDDTAARTSDHDPDGYVRARGTDAMDILVQSAVEGHVSFARKGDSRWKDTQ